MGGGRLAGPSAEIVTRFWHGVSMVIGAVLIFALGWLVAKFIRVLVTRFFKIIKIDELSENSGLKTFLEKGNIDREVSELLGLAIYWVIMLVVVFIAVEFAGVAIPPTVIDGLLGFIPRLILGLLIFIFSIFLGTFFSGIVKTTAGNCGIAKAELLGKITQTAIIVFGVVIALQQIGIAGEFIGNVFIIILAAFCFGSALAFALAFGLGGKDIAKKYMETMFEKKPGEDDKKQ
ncbi:MAG TPA: hypothetical protein PKN36_09245 [bacterium]|nr:hypothetical protein [bacterium]